MKKIKTTRRITYQLYFIGLGIIIAAFLIIGFDISHLNTYEQLLLLSLWCLNAGLGVWLIITIRKDEFDKPKRTEPLNISEGLVRIYLIIVSSIVLISYLIGVTELEIPIHLLVVMGIILTFYKIKSDKVLPKKFVQSSATQSFIVSEYYLQNYKNVKSQIKDIIKKSQNILKKSKETADYIDTLDQKDDLREVESLLKNDLKMSTITEKLALFLLVILVAVIGWKFITLSTTSPDAETILIISSSRVLVGIVLGSIISDILIIILWKNNLKDNLNTFNKEVKIQIGNYNQITFSEKLKVFQKHESVQLILFDFIAIAAIHLMTLSCVYIILEPTINTNSLAFIILEVVIAMYFGTK